MNIDTIVKRLNKDFPEFHWSPKYVGDYDKVQGFYYDDKFGVVEYQTTIEFDMAMFYKYSSYSKLKSDILCAIKSIKGE